MTDRRAEVLIEDAGKLKNWASVVLPNYTRLIAPS